VLPAILLASLLIDNNIDIGQVYFEDGPSLCLV